MVLPSPTGYVVWCESCPRSFEVATETAAEFAAAKHNRQDARWDHTMEYVADLAARPRPLIDTGHVHSFRCTFEICGTGPTRAELVAKSSARYRTR
jgi:hypothetical protein